MKMTKNLCNSVIVLALFVIAGCAAPQAKLRYVWPPLPDEPKIEYLGVFNNEKDIESDSLATKLLGSEPSQIALRNPQMAAGDGNGRVYVSDIKLAAVVVFDFNSRKVSLLGGEGVFEQPTGIALDGDGNIYAADSAKGKIMVFSPNGAPYGNINLSDKVKSIGFIAIDKQRKRIIVPDPKEHTVHIVDFKGAIITSIEKYKTPEDDGFKRPNAVAVAPNGDIVVADTFNARVVIFNSEGKYLSNFGERGDNPGQFNLIQGIAVDSSGHIYTTDARDNRFTIMSAKGEFLLPIGSGGDSLRTVGTFQIPFGISIDQNDTIYIVEKYYSRFQKYQYLSADYLAKNPLKPESLAKPIEEDKSKKKGDPANLSPK